MLYHHDGRSYNEAATEAAKKARQKLEHRIELGKQSGGALIEKVQNEVPIDYIVSGSSLAFLVPEEGRSVRISTWSDKGPKNWGIHKHAMNQLCGRGNIPVRYASHLLSEDCRGWGPDLLAFNLSQVYQKGNEKTKYLFRGYDETLRGFLSDRYRRLDSRPLLEAFATACQEFNAVPIEGYATDTKVALKAVLPIVFEPVEHEVLGIGVMWENSDYGNGKHLLSGFIDRLWCTNYAVMTERFSQVHLGRRLSEDLSFSQRTYELDTQTQASAIKDLVKNLISPDAVDTYCGLVKAANEKKINSQYEFAKLKKELSKSELASVSDKFNEPDVEELPPGNTAWRLSNAISWVAGNKVEDTERKIEMMKLAGKVIES